MKKRLSVILLIAVFLVGLSLLLYPTVSNYVNSLHQSRAIAGYEEGMTKMTRQDYSAFREAAEEYNRELARNSGGFLLPGEDEAEYNSILNPTGTGIMGYVDVSFIGVKLPVYHGTDEEVLQIGVGHLEGSSLPVGGETSHCILSGHRGLPSARLLTDLDKLTVGDVFLLHTLDQVLAYKVDQILIVEPEDTASLQLEEGKDYCTLVTCTPYGVNSHRLLVRGVRTEYDAAAMQMLNISADAEKVDPLLVAPVLAVPMVFGLLIWLFAGAGGKRTKSGKEQGRP